MELGKWLKHAYAISIVVLLHINASLSVGHHHANVTRCVERERDALLAIKRDLVDNHNLLSSWDSGSEAQKQDCCRWERVYCDNQTGHVLRLDLGSDNPWHDSKYIGRTFSPAFEGKISPQLIQLHDLTYLNLSYNYLNGSQIPAFIGSLTSLRYLDLHFAGFHGQIPSHALGNLTHLTYLDLSHNYFDENQFPAFIGSLTSLRYLDLSQAGFGGQIPSHALGNLSHLTYLDLSDNAFNGSQSPSHALGNFTHLTYLDLSGNDFYVSQIAAFIGSLTNLRYLDLSSALFGGQIPSHALGNLTHLTYLDLNDNAFNGSQSSSHALGNLTHLEYLDLAGSFDNFYVENLNWLPYLFSLKYLDLSDTNLSHVFDWLETVNKLPNLRNLTLTSCELPPPILSHINSSKSLASVSLSGTNLTSSIFKWLCNYNTTLVYLDLSDNKLSGSLPDVFGNMSSLAYLSLDENQLEGGIPDSFAKLCGLQYLDIRLNNLSGNISNFFESSCAQNSLETLYAYGNHLVGPFPDLTKFMALKTLFLDGNQLSGAIPKSIGQLSKLETFIVGDNNLDGVISETHFSQLSKLQWLDLSSNSLVLDFHSEWVPRFQLHSLSLGSCKMGPLFPKWLRTQKNLDLLSIYDAGISDIIPSWFGDWSQNISMMDLSRNEIKGTLLANSGFEFPQVSMWNLSWNQLEGPIPSFFSKASSLDLSNNKFSKVDSFLCSTNVNYLSFLNLSSNQVSGELPDCWMHFEDLVFLDLSNNKFSGNIPTTMGSLSSIQTLKLDNNRFGGELPSSLKNCTNLRAFDLESNELSGPIPKWLGQVSNLAILILRSNHFNGSMPSQLCHLTSIQVLDLSINNISGSIPKCLDNLTTMAQKGSPNLAIWHNYEGRNGYGTIGRSYDDEVSIMWKGIFAKYKSTLGLLKSIDFSSNRLTGEIPSAITDLVGLVSLNLSRNHLTGQITPDIGKLQSLDSLDISRNHIHGAIPTSLARIDRLAYLDLSYNNLSGEIPIGTQLQGFDPSIYAGNSQLCGLPLKKICDPKGTGQPNVSSNQEDHDELIMQGFYISLGLGFAAGFWGVCGSLIFKKSWRYTYYKFLNASNDWLYVKVALIRRKLKDVLNRQS